VCKNSNSLKTLGVRRDSLRDNLRSCARTWTRFPFSSSRSPVGLTNISNMCYPGCSTESRLRILRPSAGDPNRSCGLGCGVACARDSGGAPASDANAARRVRLSAGHAEVEKNVALVPHSQRNARIGSTCVARRAGMNPDVTATDAIAIVAKMIVKLSFAWIP
jgi:hypothetical protein